MFHIITRVTYKHGGTSVYRDEDTTADIEYWEKYRGDDPNISDATVINVFEIKDEEGED